MRTPRADLVISGQVIVAAEPSGIETARAIGIAGGRIVTAGSRDDVTDAAVPGARHLDFGERSIIPGVHDFHIHLVGLARARAALTLDDAADGAEVAERLQIAARSSDRDAWITGRGWSEAQLTSHGSAAWSEAVADRLAFISSHDGHSAWASAAAFRLAGVTAATSDPVGGRIERDAAGSPTGVLRERALDLIAPRVARLQGAALRDPLDATLRELAALGITGASEAGDYTDQNGIGPDAALGDSYSSLTDLGDLVDGRLRLTLGMPVDALAAAAAAGHRTGIPIANRRTMRVGWAKEYADGSLGSGTAALFEPRTCGEGGTGILRVDDAGLDRVFALARSAGIGLAIHAIGDRAAAAVLAAVGRAEPRRPGAPRDRIEHAQLVRRADARRFASADIIASIQPIHAAADRDLVESCWDGRQDDAYAWRAFVDAGVQLAAGSDAPVESVNPWLGIFAAVHRRLPTDGRGDWRPGQALTIAEALHAYTLGPARAIGAADEGHLRPGARADIAVLSTSLDTVLSGDERLADVSAVLTLVDGEVTHSA
jgi:predicted amidohydrolase YtcJ